MLEQVTQTPDWLVKRMDEISKQAPPTIEEVRAQFKGSNEWINLHRRQTADVEDIINKEFFGRLTEYGLS